MALGRLNIQAVRNLVGISLEDLQAANVFYGENGGGKTSVLESAITRRSISITLKRMKKRAVMVIPISFIDRHVLRAIKTKTPKIATPTAATTDLFEPGETAQWRKDIPEGL